MKFDSLKFEALDEKVYGKSYKTKDGWVHNPCQAHTTLPNGIEVSIVKHGASYGHEEGLYEMGAFHKGGKDMMNIEAWSDEVKGWLNPEDVEKELFYLESIPKHCLPLKLDRN